VAGHSSGIEVDAVRSGERARVIVSGELNRATAGDLQVVLDDLVGTGVKDLVLDLGRLEFMDWPGAELIDRLDERSRLDGFSLSLVRGGESIQQTLRVAGLEGRLTFVDG
jgi:anti-sigma B factor antagonist